MTEADYAVPGLQDVPAAWRPIVVKLLAYAEQRGLHCYRRDGGWTVKKRHHVIFQLRVHKHPAGVVPQLYYFRMWNDPALVDEFQHRLSGLIDVPKLNFPTVSIEKLQAQPEVLAQLCDTFDWFLEQTRERASATRE